MYLFAGNRLMCPSKSVLALSVMGSRGVGKHMAISSMRLRNGPELFSSIPGEMERWRCGEVGMREMREEQLINTLTNHDSATCAIE
jgi:hypothetical protein